MSTASKMSGYESSAVTPQELSAVGAALADVTRVRMLRLLLANEEVACASLETTFSLTKSTISYHVRVLRLAGLIRVRKAGKFYHYSMPRDEVATRFPGLMPLLSSIAVPQLAEPEGAPCGVWQGDAIQE